MSDKFPPFLKWGTYKKTTEADPDILHLKIIDAEPNDTQYSTNIDAFVEEVENTVPLWNFESENKSLLNDYTKIWRKGVIKDGTALVIKTWMGHSKKHPQRTMRRWKLESIS